MPDILKAVTVYTANFGNYDTVTAPMTQYPYIEYLLYTDSANDLVGWKQIVCHSTLSAVREARKRKVLSHIYTSTEYSIWHDGNIRLLVNPGALCDMLGDTDLLVFTHPYRDCVYEEAKACIELGKDGIETLARQTQQYRARGFPAHNGLCETSILVRRHSEMITRFNERWWAEIETGSHRDQVSFDYVIWEMGLRIKVLGGSIKQSPYLEHLGRHNVNV